MFALQVSPGRPRAEAHMWGKVARIPTEINRLTQLISPLTVKSQPEFSTGNRHSLRIFESQTGLPRACPLVPFF
jgi:hypothetical protein